MQIDEIRASLPRLSRADAIAARIERRIREEDLPAGYRLGTKATIRHEFSVAVATVNEAIRLLTSRGTVVVRPGVGGGIFVAHPTALVRLGTKMLELSGESVSVADSLVIRRALEPLVLSDAVRARTTRDIDALRVILAEMERPGLEIDEYLRVNWRLHRRMVEISPNLVLRHMYIGLLDFVAGRVDRVTSETGHPDQSSIRVHRDMVDAIAAGDEASVIAVSRRHAEVTDNDWSTGGSRGS